MFFHELLFVQVKSIQPVSNRAVYPAKIIHGAVQSPMKSRMVVPSAIGNISQLHQWLITSPATMMPAVDPIPLLMSIITPWPRPLWFSGETRSICRWPAMVMKLNAMP